MENCKICNKEFKNYNSISAHIRHQHKITSKEYYDVYLIKTKEGNCLLCNNKTNYINIQFGYKKYCKTCNNPKTKEQYIKVYGMPEGEDLFNVYCSKIKNSMTGKNKGEENGQYKYPKKVINCSECNKEIKRHGISENENYFCDINCKALWQSKNAPPKELNSFNIYKNKIKQVKLEKYGNENYNNSLKGINTKIKNGTLTHNLSHQSILANTFFDKLYEILPKNYKYYFKDNETFIWNNKKLYFYDFECRETKKIIEFNGDYWHANPYLYKIGDKIRNINVEEIWEKDQIKNKTAINKGFDVLVVWERDVNYDFNNMLNKCFNFIFDTEVRI